MRPSEALASILLFSSACAAGRAGWDPIGNVHDVLPMYRRQENDNNNDNNNEQTSFDLSFTGVQGNTATEEAPSEETGDNNEATSTADSNDAEQTDEPSESESESGTRRASGTARETTRTFDARLPAGGISMITPNALTPSYIKVGNTATFAWNYTSLSVTPAAIDILATCTLNQHTYTIALNQSVEETQTVLWDTGAYQADATVPLLTETYTLIVHDSAEDVTARPRAGYLGTYNQFTFGMYTPQAYTSLSDYRCVTCNSAMSLAEKQTLWALLGMAGLTVLSFGWFTGVAGLW